MIIALAQINTATGDLDGNSKKIKKYLTNARQKKVDLVIFPELSLVGYPPKDLLFQDGFIDQVEQKLQSIIKEFSDVNFLLGSVEKSIEHRFWNVVHFVSNGEIKSTAKKNLLPTYDVFDERRYFSAADEVLKIELNGKKIGITICEDIWSTKIPFYSHDPLDLFKPSEMDLMINISASPFDYEKYKQRLELIGYYAKKLSTPFIYVNLVGGNDELIFDGGSFISDDKGSIVQQLPFFEECFEDYDTDQSTIQFSPPMSDVDAVAQALTIGMRDFVYKSGYRDVALGLSGGVDSAVMLLLAIRAFGYEHVYPMFMPSAYTSQASIDDVKHMAHKSMITVLTYRIDPVVDSIVSTMDDDLQTLTLENIQARSRAILLAAYAAEKKALILNTTNKSEMSVGYGTLYGDMIGALSPIADLYKHQVYAVGKLLNQYDKIIPERVFTRAPSAELRENQKDSDSLPEYDVLDPILKKYIEEEKSIDQIVNEGHDRTIVEKMILMISQSEFKRKQTPPVLRISSKSFGVGRRMPIARKLYDV